MESNSTKNQKMHHLQAPIEAFDPQSIVPEADEPESKDPDEENTPKKFSPFKLK